MSVSYGFLSTFPPTRSGLADFSRTLLENLAAAGDTGGVVRVLGESESPGGVGVAGNLVPGSRLSMLSAAAELNRFDVAVVQHEYGIYAGPDGESVLDLLAKVHVPTIAVLHTVLSVPSPHQREVLERVAGAADTVVVLSDAAASLLMQTYSVDASKVSVIARGDSSPAEIPGIAEVPARLSEFDHFDTSADAYRWPRQAAAVPGLAAAQPSSPGSGLAPRTPAWSTIADRYRELAVSLLAARKAAVPAGSDVRTAA